LEFGVQRSAMNGSAAAYDQLKHSLKLRLAQLSNTQRGPATLDRDTIAAQLKFLVNAIGGAQKAGVNGEDQERLVAEIASEVLGAGPLDPLLADPEIIEIMVNGPSQVFVERLGRMERSPVTFRDNDQLLFIIERILDRAGLTVNEAEPLVDASLPDGTRVNVIIPPLSLDGPLITLRKKSRRWDLDGLLAQQSLSKEAAEFLVACVAAKANIIISGGTSTGKTTLVSVLSAFIPPEERIITIENVAELELVNREHWIRLVARAPNIEGKGEIPLRALVANALRMRPDRIILGEARGGEALDVVQAMTTGHDGVITVLHANSTRSAVERLETLMLMSGLELPPFACRAQIASAVDLIVHLMRFADGRRCIGAITQVLGNAQEGIAIEDLFSLDTEGRPEGEARQGLRYTGAKPKFLSKFRFNNVEVPAWVKTS
jgi:pilus assembly protein CpaF